MADRIKAYEKYALDIKRLMLASGLWADPIYTKKMRYLAVYHMIGLTIICSAMINCIYRHSGNVIIMIRGFALLVGVLIAIMKILLFWTYRNDLEKMHKVLETTFREDMAAPEFQTDMLSPLHYFAGPTTVLSRSCIGIILSTFISPAIVIIVQSVRGDFPIKYVKPLLTKYPWDHGRSFGIYAGHFVGEFIITFGGAVISTAVDCAFGYYIFQTGTQFRSLSHRMRNLKSSDDYRAVIEVCVLRHQLLGKCCDTLERVYGPIALVFMTTSAMMLCCNIFLLSKMGCNDLLVSICYICMKTLQTFLYGWFGLFLMAETEDFRDAVYSSGWPGSGEIPFMTDILIMLVPKRPGVSACGFSTISLDMFTAVMNTAVSYYFLLTTIEESK